MSLTQSEPRHWNFLQPLLDALRGDRAAYPLGYMASFDGTRGLMTLGIMLAHTRMALFEGAMVYMDVFFTMSGFLITSILIKDQVKNGRIGLRKFYVRRLLRLYPALIAMVVALVVLSALFSPIFKARLAEAGLSLLYLNDIPPLLSLGADFKYTAHTWSLAIEEQFYLVWPLALIGLTRMWGLSRRTALAVFAAAAFFWALRVWMVVSGVELSWLYSGFPSRADALLVGCGLAILLHTFSLNDHPRFWAFCSGALLPLAIAMVICGFTMTRGMRWYYAVSPLFGALPAAISIIGLLHPDRSLMHRVYDHPLPVFVGRICYGLYIWHVPVFGVIDNYVNAWPTRYIMTFLIGWPVAFTLAILSYSFIERPFMRARPAV